MPRVMSWEDTHEAAYFRTRLLTAEDEPVSIEELGLDWFGQSWSMQPESDAMWRIYNQQHDSIRLETTAGALLGTLHVARTNIESQFADLLMEKRLDVCAPMAALQPGLYRVADPRIESG